MQANSRIAKRRETIRKNMAGETQENKPHRTNRKAKPIRVELPVDGNIERGSKLKKSSNEKTAILGAHKMAPATSNHSKEAVAKRKALFLEVYEKSMCNMSLTCRQMGISRETARTWMVSDPDFRALVDELQETRIDFVENALDKQVKEGNMTAICFYLKCRAKHRGYVERQEITGAGGGPMQLLQGELSQEALKSAMRKIMEDKQ